MALVEPPVTITRRTAFSKACSKMVGGKMVGGQIVGDKMIGGKMVGGKMVGGKIVGVGIVGDRTSERGHLVSRVLLATSCYLLPSYCHSCATAHYPLHPRTFMVMTSLTLTPTPTPTLILTLRPAPSWS